MLLNVTGVHHLVRRIEITRVAVLSRYRPRAAPGLHRVKPAHPVTSRWRPSSTTISGVSSADDPWALWVVCWGDLPEG